MFSSIGQFSLSEMFKRLRRSMVKRYLLYRTSPYLPNANTALIVAPHPDDETFGCGGLIALKLAQGAVVHVLILSRGEGGHRGCCTIREEVVAVERTRQAEHACAKLGLSKANLHWLDFPDGNIKQGDCAKVTKIQALIDKVVPMEIYAPAPFDCWVDHERACEIIKKIISGHKNDISLYVYPIWMWYNLRLRDLGRLNGWHALNLDIRAVQATKREAMRYYLSEINLLCGTRWCGNLPEGFSRPFYDDFEIFFQQKEGVS
ncbi:MAG: PIG-L deacetylase family protein [Gallionella sp.]|jgi:LmbE family N-acetylglucosaminyl deacetylase